MMNDKEFGAYGETEAVKYLLAKGYQVLERNFRCKLGEIDCVAKDHEVIVFVEVKSRASLSHGMPYESVHFYKRHKLIKLAQYYLLSKYGKIDIASRFDVISVYQDEAGGICLQHMCNAFEVPV